MSEPEFYTVEEVARLFRMSERTVQRRIAQGRIPTVPLLGVKRISARFVQQALISPAAAEASPAQRTAVGDSTKNKSQPAA